MSKTVRRISFKLAVELEIPSELKQERLARKVKRIDRKHQQATGSDSNKLRFREIDDELMDFGQKHKRAFHRYLKHVERQKIKKAFRDYIEDFDE